MIDDSIKNRSSLHRWGAIIGVVDTIIVYFSISVKESGLTASLATTTSSKDDTSTINDKSAP